jgi:hypothetical protein
MCRPWFDHNDVQVRQSPEAIQVVRDDRAFVFNRQRSYPEVMVALAWSPTGLFVGSTQHGEDRRRVPCDLNDRQLFDRLEKACTTNSKRRVGESLFAGLKFADRDDRDIGGDVVSDAEQRGPVD